MPPNYSMEFTPELNQSYLESILAPIEERKAAAVAAARREGEAAGLIGQASTGTRIAEAEHLYGRDQNQAIAAFNRDVAGMKREERLTGEQRAYADLERKKAEDFQREMSELGYRRAMNLEKEREHAAGKFDWGGFAAGLVGKTASAAAGGYFGGLGTRMGLGSLSSDGEEMSRNYGPNPNQYARMIGFLDRRG